MKPKLALKNIYRSFVRSIFIFILLASTTCLLFSNIMEFYVSKRETEKAIETFDGIGTLERRAVSAYAENMKYGEYILSDPRVLLDFYPEDRAKIYRGKMSYDRMTDSDIEKIEGMENITYTDKRYMTSGVSDTYTRLDMDTDYYYDFTNCYVVEATVEKWYDHMGRLLVKDIEFIGGTKHVNFQYDKLWIEPEFTAGDDIEGEWLVLSSMGHESDKSRYTTPWCKALEEGGRYVFIGKMQYVVGGQDYQMLSLTDNFAYGWCDGVWSLESEGEDYLETEKFAPLREYINLIETDIYTFDVVYTQNMNAIRYFADGTLAITDGRRLNRQDYLNGSNVCVINHEVARVYGLEVGDTITLDLGNKLFEQYEGVGAIAAVPERLATEYTNVTLEIVGIWKDTRHRTLKANDPDPCWSYNINTVFVPTHLLNADEDELNNHTFAMGEFSFVIEDIYAVESFNKRSLTTMGLRLTLDDGNWKEIEDAIKESETMSYIKIAILSAAVFASLWFTVLLYVLGRKRDYAIMRVLGTTKKQSKNTLLLPLSVLSAVSVAVGAAAAWIYTANNIEFDFSLSQMSEYTTDVNVPVWLVVSCTAAVFVIAYLIASVIISFIGRKSPLALLQNNTQKRAKKKKKKIAEPEDAVLGQWVSLPKPKWDGKKRKLSFICRFVLRNIRRAKIKAIMFVLVTVLLLNVAGQLNIMLDTYTETFETTEVVSTYAGSLNLNYVSQLQESGYVKDVFYRSETTLDVDTVEIKAYITNDINRVLVTGSKITWAEGYDESVMQSHENIIVMDKFLMEKYGYKLGDTVKVSKGGTFEMQVRTSINLYKDTWENITTEELEAEIRAELVPWFNERSGELIIAGCVDTGPMPVIPESMPLTEEQIKGVYLPGTMDMNTAYGKLVIMEMTEATLVDNWKRDEYREYGRALADANLTFEVAFIMETELVDYLAGVILLLELVAPVAIIAMLIIGMFMTCLIILQSTKDIAIMRVLGTSKKRTRAIIVLERIVLCIIGVVIALAVTFIMRGSSETVVHHVSIVYSLYFAAILLSSAIASVAATRKNVLELLQTKE